MIGYSRADLILSTFRNCDETEKKQVVSFVRSLTDEPLPEGKSAFTHEAHDIFIFREKYKNDIVAIAGFFAPNDGSECFGILKWILVHKDFRQRKAGNIIVEHMNDYVQNIVNKGGCERVITLVAPDRHTETMYTRLGFLPALVLPFLNIQIYKKTYKVEPV